jgi:eukaryotic-like serine/threonine-protein kinase
MGEMGTRGEKATTAVVDGPRLAPGRRLGERYLLERPLGHGGMAAVWLATDQRLGRPVAVKVLSDTLAHDGEYLDRFRREAHVAAGLQHPNLVSIYDFDAGDRPYLVMEYVPGGDLAERVEAGEVPDAESLARELLSALRHIHAAGVLHRDIKPQNVLIDAAGHARLTDFGIAQPHDATALTKTGQVIGTETYLAPEVKRGEPASERSDLFALGVVLADASREGAAAALWELTDRLRDPDPERRPGSAAAALASLERRSGPAGPPTATQPFAATAPTEAAASGPPPTRPFTPSPTGVREPARRRTVVGLIAVGLVLVALIVGLALGSGGDDSPPVDVRERGEGAAAQSGGGDTGATSPPAPTEAPADGGTAEPTQSDSEPPPSDSEPASNDAAEAPTDGAALNDQGFALNEEGRYEEAVPVLEEAVAALEGGDETLHNYALYNLGVAYLGAGRPEDAIPVLEQRMQFDDGQLDQVQATLDEAYAAAGETPPDDKPGNGPKDKPQKAEKVPPPFEGDD